MTAVHDLRGRLHAARLHLTFVERALAKPGNDPDLVDAVKATAQEFREVERLVLALLAPGPACPARET